FMFGAAWPFASASAVVFELQKERVKSGRKPASRRFAGAFFRRFPGHAEHSFRRSVPTTALAPHDRFRRRSVTVHEERSPKRMGGTGNRTRNRDEDHCASSNLARCSARPSDRAL